MTTRHYFDIELEKLQHLIIRMGSLVEESIDNTINALKNQDVSLARAIFKNDDEIDELEQKIERVCLNLIARQQPLAKDLRTISTALKIITDMERIADHSSDIAEITLRMAKEKYIKSLDNVKKMANAAKKMVNNAIDSYIKQDLGLAMSVCSNDDVVDNLFMEIVLDYIEAMKTSPSSIEQGINFMFIAKYIERMGDHATNIAEWVVYNITGEHRHLTKYLHKDEHHKEHTPKFIQNILDDIDNGSVK